MKKLLVSVLFICGFSVLATAQPRDEGRNAPIRPGSITTEVPTGDTRPYSRTVTGKVIKVDGDDGFMVVEDPKSGPLKVILSKDTRLKADKKTELGDKKEIAFTDYKAGQTVKLTLRVYDNKLLEVRLKPAKD